MLNLTSVIIPALFLLRALLNVLKRRHCRKWTVSFVDRRGQSSSAGSRVCKLAAQQSYWVGFALERWYSEQLCLIDKFIAHW